MIPVVTPAEMSAIDAAAPWSEEVLISRAGTAVAAVAAEMLTGEELLNPEEYGLHVRPSEHGISLPETAPGSWRKNRQKRRRRQTLRRKRVVVIAGPGSNGDDGRVAAKVLSRQGTECLIIAPEERVIPPADLVIDAAFGIGLSRPYDPPPSGDPVLAVDIPSGIDGLTGEMLGGALRAERTVTFAAYKPGLLFGAGRKMAGDVTLADIGLDVLSARVHLFGDADAAVRRRRRPADAHKWDSACWVVGGSPGMFGAPRLAAAAALRTGAGYVRLSIPGEASDPKAPLEVVSHELPAERWAEHVRSERFKSLVVGPGLGRSAKTADEVGRLLAGLKVPVVLDGDALGSLGRNLPAAASRAAAPVVITPHDGEFAALTGSPPGGDRIAAARELAAASAAHVLLKGPTTVVAAPDGEALLVTSGDARLATAGTGDVLSGMIGALLAGGNTPLDAAAVAAHVHGAAACLGPEAGLIASDLIERIPQAFASLARFDEEDD